MASNVRRERETPHVFDTDSNFDTDSPAYKHKEIGFFSLDINRKFLNSDKQLKYFVKPRNYSNVHFDLREGLETMIRKDESKKEYVDDILRWSLQNRESLANTDFVCWRGLLKKLMYTPYERREDWLVAVTLHNGTYFMSELETEQKKQENENRTDRDDEMCCWGWKFEQFLTADSPDGKPDTKTPYNNCEAFCTVQRFELDTHTLVFAGEVDAVHTDSKYGQHYIELKTNREFSDNPKQMINFKRMFFRRIQRHKILRWWAQSFLVNVPEIICGFRDDDGIVHRLESFSVKNLPKLALDDRYPWKPNICLNFLNQLLTFIKRTVTVDDHRTVYLLTWSPENPVTCSKPMRDSEYNFLPDWFVKA